MNIPIAGFPYCLRNTFFQNLLKGFGGSYNFFFIQNLIDRFYTNYTSRDIITYRRDYAIKKLKEFEQALSELGDKDEL